MEIMYVLSKPKSESDTIILKASVDPSWMRQRTPQMKEVPWWYKQRSLGDETRN